MPPAIEAKFATLCPYAGQFMVFGEGRNFAVALVTLDADSIGGWAKERGLADISYEELTKSSTKCTTWSRSTSRQLNASLNRWETIKKWALLDYELSVERRPADTVAEGEARGGRRAEQGDPGWLLCLTVPSPLHPKPSHPLSCPTPSTRRYRDICCARWSGAPAWSTFRPASAARRIAGWPRGDGHPVLVLPGFLAGPGSTRTAA